MKMRNVLVVTGDPGGARVLIPAVKRLKKKYPRWRFKILAGQNSHRLWSAAGFRPELWSSVQLNEKQALKIFSAKKPDLLIAGTSFENPTESWFRLAASRARVASFSALDHWSNYRERFEVGKRRLILPNTIGVMDDFARKKMCEREIPLGRLAVVGHPVLEPFVEKRKKRTLKKKQVLFISEPISWDGKLNPKIIRFPRHNELTILKRLFSVYRQNPELMKGSLQIRPHPLEPLVRLRKIVDQFAPKDLKVVVDRSRSLEKDFASSGIVLGITSIALLQAKLMGLSVLSLHPPHVHGWIPDDIVGFLPSVRSGDCFIEAVSKFISTQKTDNKLFYPGKPLMLPKNCANRIVSQIERMIYAKKS